MPYDRVTPNLLLASTRKLLDIQKDVAEPDDRDSLSNQTVHGPEDLFSERIEKDSGGVLRNMLWKSTNKGKLSGVYSGLHSGQFEHVLLNSGIGSAAEEVNPLELVDQSFRLTRLGEGAIPSEDSIPMEARAVQPSYFGFVDPHRAPESGRIGVELRTTFDTYKGKDNQLYSKFTDTKTGKEAFVSSQQAGEKTIAFPGEMNSGKQKVRALVHGKLDYVDREEVDYELPHPTGMFNANVNLIPMLNSVQGTRHLTGGKMVNQALALNTPEAPLVRAETQAPGVSFDELMGRKVGAVFADQDGTVIRSAPHALTVKYADGTTKDHELYQNFPFNRKSYIHSTSAVKAGDLIKKNQLLARSNYTDDKGTLAIGTNLRVGFLPYKGITYEDAYVISQSAAHKLKSEHMYTPELDFEEGVEHGYDKYIARFPTKYGKEQLSVLDKDGAIQVGAKVKKGDPLILAIGKAGSKGEGQWSQIARQAESSFRDKTVEWEHPYDGEITDVVKGKNGIQVAVKAYVPAEEADKISGRYGDKGVIGAIVPDEQMPKDSQGRPFEVLQNPMTLPTRLNPAQIFEMQLAKVARKTGKPVLMPAFFKGSLVDHVSNELRKHGLSDTEDVLDPETNKKIKNVLTGEKFFMKLQHTAESKQGARDVGGYTAEDLPSSGGKEGSKTIATLGLNALLSHGATAVIRDLKNIRGQRNDDYWRAFKLGYTPPSPQISTAYKKFEAYLRGSGVNLKKVGDQEQLFAMTDADIDKLSSGEIGSPDTVNMKDMQPIEGGLFDRATTGGHGGKKFAHISLPEPIPNPVMEDPIRRLLGLTNKQLQAVIGGTQDINGRTGGVAIREALSRIKVDDAMAVAREEIRGRTGAARDAAIKRLRILSTLKDTGIKPEDMTITKMPVVPPQFRPITQMKPGMSVAADANYLYQDLLHAKDAYHEVSKEFGKPSDIERLNVYNAAKAVTGLGDPIGQKTVDTGIGGLLQHVFGKATPKYGLFQRRIIGTKADMTGRGVVVPNPALDMDQIGMPEDQAWHSFKPFVIRRLVRRGVSASQAADMVENRDARAKAELVAEMDVRPILFTRAPVLHRYGIMAARPVLVAGKALQVSPTITAPMTMDFDGDTASYHVPVSDEAVKEAYARMLPSKNLKSMATFDVQYTPRHEYVYGLYQASKKRNKGEVKRFATAKDALNAYRRGEVDLGDEVVVGK